MLQDNPIKPKTSSPLKKSNVPMGPIPTSFNHCLTLEKPLPKFSEPRLPLSHKSTDSPISNGQNCPQPLQQTNQKTPLFRDFSLVNVQQKGPRKTTSSSKEIPSDNIKSEPLSNLDLPSEREDNMMKIPKRVSVESLVQF